MRLKRHKERGLLVYFVEFVCIAENPFIICFLLIWSNLRLQQMSWLLLKHDNTFPMFSWKMASGRVADVFPFICFFTFVPWKLLLARGKSCNFCIHSDELQRLHCDAIGLMVAKGDHPQMALFHFCYGFVNHWKEPPLHGGTGNPTYLQVIQVMDDHDLVVEAMLSFWFRAFLWLNQCRKPLIREWYPYHCQMDREESPATSVSKGAGRGWT